VIYVDKRKIENGWVVGFATEDVFTAVRLEDVAAFTVLRNDVHNFYIRLITKMPITAEGGTTLVIGNQFTTHSECELAMKAFMNRIGLELII
jgi:hypothetical protein